MITLSAADLKMLQGGGVVMLWGPAPIINPPPPPPPAPPASGSFVLYADGKFAWPGSYSFGLTANYKDTTGKPASGTYCMECDLTSSFGGWLPYAPGWDFKAGGFKNLEFDLKASIANQTWDVYGVKVGDVNYGLPECRVIDYGPTPGKSPPPGVWQHYKIPLPKIMNDQDLYKWCLQDKTGLSSNRFWANNVAFTP